MLYFAVGVRDSRNSSDDDSDRIKAQQLDNHAGKVLRLTEDGRAPQDNPFVGKPGAKPEIYTYGHRNLQGFTWHPDTREMWATEIGPMGGDELNRLDPGRQLRLAAGLARQDLQLESRVGSAVVAAGHGDAGDVLDARDQPFEHHDLHREIAFRCGKATSSSAR